MLLFNIYAFNIITATYFKYYVRCNIQIDIKIYVFKLFYIFNLAALNLDVLYINLFFFAHENIEPYA